MLSINQNAVHSRRRDVEKAVKEMLDMTWKSFVSKDLWDKRDISSF